MRMVSKRKWKCVQIEHILPVGVGMWYQSRLMGKQLMKGTDSKAA